MDRVFDVLKLLFPCGKVFVFHAFGGREIFQNRSSKNANRLPKRCDKKGEEMVEKGLHLHKTLLR